MIGSWFRQTLRMILRARMPYGVAIVALAAGIGVTTALFSIINAVLLRPLELADQNRIALVWKSDPHSPEAVGEFSWPEIRDLRTRSRSFEDLAAMPTTVYGYELVLTGHGEPVQLDGSRVSYNLFSVLGVKPYMGSTFTADDDRPGAAPVVILGYHVWSQLLGADPNIVGKALELSGQTYRVVGVMPRSFDFPHTVELWIPVATSQEVVQNRRNTFLQAIGRLRSGISVGGARNECNLLLAAMREEHPELGKGVDRSVVTLVTDYYVGRARNTLYVSLYASWLLLAMSCTTTALIFTSLVLGREREIAIRLALGASRATVIRQFLAEGLTVSLIACCFGLGLALILTPVLVHNAPEDIPRIGQATLDWSAMAFAVSAALVTGLLSSIGPALLAAREDCNRNMQEGGSRMSGSARGKRLQLTLTAAQVAFTLLLVVSALLVVASVKKIRDADLGYQTKRVVTMQLRLQGTRYQEPEQLREFYRSVLMQSRRAPAVESAAGILLRPLQGNIGWETAYAPERGQTGLEQPLPIANLEVVTPGYFGTLGIPVTAGRDFSELDKEDTEHVAVISSKLAKELFAAGIAPLNSRIRLGRRLDGPLWRVVGIAGNTRGHGLSDLRGEIYLSFLQSPLPVRYLIVRTRRSDELAATKVVRQIVDSIDPSQVISKIATMDELASRAFARDRFNMSLLSIFAGVALFLGGLGVYSLVAETIAERSREFGIRIAIGATPSSLARRIVGGALKVAIAGEIAGCFLSLVAVHYLEPILYRTNSHDPALWGFAAAFILLVCALAGSISAGSILSVRAASVLR